MCSWVTLYGCRLIVYMTTLGCDHACRTVYLLPGNSKLCVYCEQHVWTDARRIIRNAEHYRFRDHYRRSRRRFKNVLCNEQKKQNRIRFLCFLRAHGRFCRKKNNSNKNTNNWISDGSIFMTVLRFVCVCVCMEGEGDNDNDFKKPFGTRTPVIGLTGRNGNPHADRSQNNGSLVRSSRRYPRVLYNVVVGRHRLVCSSRRPATSIPATHIQNAPREQAYFYRSYLSARKNGKPVWGGMTIDNTPFELLMIATLVWALKHPVFAYKTYARSNNSAVNVRRIEGPFWLHLRVGCHRLVQSFRDGSFVRW